ncbi:hypothetical protein [Hyalangium sp.]|uniref:hypothetical protein n=1 Tax=Hyalangium sp. TaxID=2028555 RepID=UPI002D6889BD|nr:hypothetical protein [Hyalangium sp.]HYI02531.1 hypothetical protein [Hyalangium sp.]
MDFTALQRSLTPAGNTVTISTDTLPRPFSDFLESYYFKQGRQIVISNAQVSADSQRAVITVTGRANFLSAANLSVTAAFSLDPAGNVQAVLRYTLLDMSNAASGWKFSNLLSELPKEMSPKARARAALTGMTSLQARRAGRIPADEPPMLDKLSFLTASVLVTTGAHTDTDTQVHFDGGGIHFLGQLRPASLIGALGAAMEPLRTVTVFGQISVLKDPTQLVLPDLMRDPSALTVYPWELQPTLPGVHLQAALGLNTQLGKLELRDTALRIFSPLSEDLLSDEDPLRPLVAVTGRFSIPSANIEVDAIVRMPQESATAVGKADVLIETRCHGLSIGNLAHMVDLVGSDDSSSALPKSLARVIQGLEKLELTDVALKVSAGATGINLSWASFTIGAPGCRWDVWKDALGVEKLGLRISVTHPLGVGGSRSTDVTIWGTALIEGVPIQILASTDGDEFTLTGTLMSQQTLPLAGLMKTWTPMLPVPANLTINRLQVSIRAGKSFRLSGALAQEPEPWKIRVGPGQLEIKNVLFDLTVPTSGDPTGSFRGDIAFGKDVTLSMAYTLPGAFVIRAVCDKVSLRSLASTLSNQKLWLPNGFDITLLDSSILISGSGGPQSSLVFQLATQISGLGNFAFEARELSTGTWGFAAGMDLGASKSSALPGLSGLGAFERMLNLRKLMLVVATYDNAQFQFPDMAQFQNPRLASGKVSLPGQGGLVAGLNLFAEWSPDSSDKTQNMLAKLLGTGSSVGVTLQVSEKETRLFFRYDARIMGYPMFGVCGVMASGALGAAPQVSWFLSGTMTVKIQGQPQTFDVTMVFTPSGMLLAGTMKGSTAVDCGPLKLSNLALEIGVNWGGIPSLGIAATIDVKSFESSLAVFFDSTNPSRSLVAGSISSLTAKDVMDTLVGGNLKTPIDDVLTGIAIKGTHEFTLPGSGANDLTDELDGLDFDKVAAAFAAAKVSIPSSSSQLLLVVNKKGAVWHLTDLTKMRHYELKKSGGTIKASIAPQFYFAPQQTSIGTLVFPQAYYLNAAISFAGFDATATVDISQSKGFSVDAQMDKIVILDEKLFSIAALQGGGGPKMSISTFTQNDNPVEKFRPPHIYINGSLTMMGVKQGIFASVSVQGIDFELVGQLVPGVKFDLDARFGKAGLGASGKVKVGVGTVDLGPLGKAKINTDLEVEVDLEIDSNLAKEVSLTPGKSYAGGSTLVSNEIAKLVFQGDGNLVLYKMNGANEQAAWASNTVGRGGSQVAFQGDGNLVIYTSAGKPVWATGSNAQGNRLVLHSDGNVVIYEGSGGVKWSSGTGGVGGGASIELESSFTFAGQHVDLGKFRLEAKADTFTKLPETLAKKVEEALREVFKDMNKWANAVSSGVMDGVNDTAKVFKDVYGKSEKEAKELANSMNKSMNQATKAVENTAKDVGKSAEKTAKSAGKATKKAIKKAKFW